MSAPFYILMLKLTRLFYLQLRVSQKDNSPLKPPLGKVNITVSYEVPKPVKDSQPQPGSGTPGNQVLPIGGILPPPRSPRETKTLWNKLVQIPQSGIIIMNATFPLAAETGQIHVRNRRIRLRLKNKKGEFEDSKAIIGTTVTRLEIAHLVNQI